MSRPESRLPAWMTEGNRTAGTAAGEMAMACQIPQDVGVRIAQTEDKATLVRRRLLRARMDPSAADPRQ
eukprot:578914-Pyramimonas_sp.AAC.1